MSKIVIHDGRTLDQAASDLVQREVLCCMSSMVATLAEGTAYSGLYHGGGNLTDLVHQAVELAAPLPDYEEAARGEGLELNPDDAKLTTWEGVCVAHDIEPYELEVYEHWAVSTWLAEKLGEAGERVDTDFAGLNVWARTTTDQAIHADAVIERITRAIHAA